jgi:hypothetical protein
VFIEGYLLLTREHDSETAILFSSPTVSTATLPVLNFAAVSKSGAGQRTRPAEAAMISQSAASPRFNLTQHH